MGKQTWIKDEAVLRQKVEFIQYQLEDEQKKGEEAEKTHQSMIASIQSSNRESVIGRTEVEAKMIDNNSRWSTKYNEDTGFDADYQDIFIHYKE